MTLTLLISGLLITGICLTWRLISTNLASNNFKERYRGDDLGYEETY